MASKPAIRCVLFDLGETLWTHVDEPTEMAILSECYQEAAHLLTSYFPTLSQSQADFFVLSKELRTIMMERYTYWRRQMFDGEPDALEVMSEACSLVNLPPLSRHQILALFEAFRPPLRRTRRLFPDTLETLHILQSHQILLGCVTDRQYGGQPFREELHALGLMHYFASHAVIVSADCGKRKPHASLFHQALSALQVTPEETAMVGDFLYRDVAGARKLNMTAIWKPKHQITDHIGAMTAFQDRQQWMQSLLNYASQQERAMYPEMPFEELEAYMQPHVVIDRPSDLLPFVLSSPEEESYHVML